MESKKNTHTHRYKGSPPQQVPDGLLLRAGVVGLALQHPFHLGDVLGHHPRQRQQFLWLPAIIVSVFDATFLTSHRTDNEGQHTTHGTRDITFFLGILVLRGTEDITRLGGGGEGDIPNRMRRETRR